MIMDIEQCRHLDQKDSLRRFRDRFSLPTSGAIHFDANSMGAMPVDVPERIEKFLKQEWCQLGRRAWTLTDWLDKPAQLGAGIAHLIGTAGSDVIVCENTTINLFKILSYAWRIRKSGGVILTQTENFPTDIHVAQGFRRFLNDIDVDLEIRYASDERDLMAKLDDDVAILYLTHVDYRTSYRLDMACLNQAAHGVNALTIWDLSHSAGVLDVDLMASKADFAVGCGYKYLCGGPGGPAFMFVHPDYQDATWPTISGWQGHAEWDAFSTNYQPAKGVTSHFTGTPAAMANEVFSAATDIWQKVDRKQLAAKHRSLTETLIALLIQECGPLGVEINSPTEYERRGGHISFRHPGAGPVSEALLDHGLISSFRYPNSIRLGLSPLYHSHEDTWQAVQRIKDVLAEEVWRDTKYESVSV